jgi:NAD(P)-dependent dehydrogenase (short-subunit alcohol dehydrogenase family)
MTQRVLITAGAGGIGFAIAKAFVAGGARVHIADVHAEAVHDITKQYPAISATVGDISKSADLDTLIHDVQEQFGGLAVLPIPPRSGDSLVSPKPCRSSWGRGITANSIHPGAVEGPRIQAVFAGRAKVSGLSVEEEIDRAMANQAIKKFVDPADIAALALFLAGPHACTSSGQTFPIDGDSKAAS